MTPSRSASAPIAIGPGTRCWNTTPSANRRSPIPSSAIRRWTSSAIAQPANSAREREVGAARARSRRRSCEVFNHGCGYGRCTTMVVEDEFIAVAHRIVWCGVATVDRRGRPRSRILHPYWERTGDGVRGWVVTRPSPLKVAHLERDAVPVVHVLGRHPRRGDRRLPRSLGGGPRRARPRLGALRLRARAARLRLPPDLARRARRARRRAAAAGPVAAARRRRDDGRHAARVEGGHRVPLTGCPPSPPASIGGSFSSFFDAVGDVLLEPRRVRWLALLLALVAFIVYLTLRARASFNILRAAYPDERIRVPQHLGRLLRRLRLQLASSRPAAATSCGCS